MAMMATLLPALCTGQAALQALRTVLQAVLFTEPPFLCLLVTPQAGTHNPTPSTLTANLSQMTSLRHSPLQPQLLPRQTALAQVHPVADALHSSKVTVQASALTGGQLQPRPHLQPKHQLQLLILKVVIQTELSSAVVTGRHSM